MENTYQATTVEQDHAGYDELHDQLMNKKNPQEVAQQQKVDQKPTSFSKKYTFRRGDDSLEIDDDYELEFVADKKPTRLTLRELKDRAAGDVAIKNRMHSLAEEKKRVQGTIKKFADIARTDPLGALEYISEQARETDSEFEYNKYIEKLAEQAEKFGQMDEKERKSWELQNKLDKAEQDLSQRERQQAVFNKKQELLSEYPGIGDSQFSDMVEAVLNNEELSEGIEDENQFMDRVEELIQETLTQRDIISLIKDINPSHIHDDELVFQLSDQIRQNADFDEEDIREILQQLIGKAPIREVVSSSQRQQDIRTLSNKARQATPESSLRTQNSTPYDLLKQQLIDRKQELQKTPLYKR